MKKVMLLLLLISSVFAQGQSLKEALYSGKLRSQPGTVIRKGDDLSALMDSAKNDSIRKATAAVDSVKVAALKTDSAAVSAAAPQTDSARVDTAVVASAEKTDTVAANAESAAPVAAAPAPAPKPKDNNAIWREYMNTVIAALKTEALSSKKIKKDTYFATVSYTIETDGQVTVNDVSLSPDNQTLKKQIQDRITLEAPRLNPVLTSTGTPRKVTRKYNFSITKE